MPWLEWREQHEDADKEKSQVEDRVLTLYGAAKALVAYIDSEYVFDKVGSMGCGGVDTHQSETFYNLIADARRAVSDFENKMKEAG